MTFSKGIHPQMAEAFGDFLLSFAIQPGTWYQ
jgi:hypothetical protein